MFGDSGQNAPSGHSGSVHDPSKRGTSGRGSGKQPKPRSGLVSIIKKEFARFFTDRRMLLTTVLMPGLFIYLIYSFIGSSISGFFSVDQDYAPSIYAVNMPGSTAALLKQSDIGYQEITAEQAEGIKQQIQDKQTDLLIVFPVGFDATLDNRGQGSQGGQSGGQDGQGSQSSQNSGQYQPPNVEVFYNSTRPESTSALGTVTALLNAYKTALSPTFDINGDSSSKYDLVTERDETGFMFASMLPMLMLIFLYSGCIAVAPESIAGEKERGTIATMLVTPLRRWELALGKIISLGVISLLSGASSFIGVMLSLPKLLSGASGGDGGESGSANAVLLYGPQDYLALIAVIISTVLLFIGLISIISALARSVKEAGTLMTPLMIVVMLVGALGMFSQGAQADPLFYLIPIYNSVQSLIGVFSFTASPVLVLLTVAVNLTLTGICVIVLTKLFNSERVIFSR